MKPSTIKTDYPNEVLAKHKKHMARFYEPGVFRQNNCPCQLYQSDGKLIKCDEIKDWDFNDWKWWRLYTMLHLIWCWKSACRCYHSSHPLPRLSTSVLFQFFLVNMVVRSWLTVQKLNSVFLKRAFFTVLLLDGCQTTMISSNHLTALLSP